MIPVTKKPEPENFDKDVRQPGMNSDTAVINPLTPKTPKYFEVDIIPFF
jgi:hypothetical protein